MKITILSPFFPHPKRGKFYGGERFTENLAFFLKKLGNEVKIVSTYWNGGTRYDNYKGIPILKIWDALAISKRYGQFFFAHYISFGLNLFRRKNFKFYQDSDIIILNCAIPFSRFFLFKKIPVVSQVFHYSHIYDTHFIVLHLLEKIQFKLHPVLTLSDLSKKDLIKYYDISPKNIKVIPVGINTQKFNPKNYSKKIKKKYGNNILLFSGLMITRKRVPVLLEAMTHVVKEIPDVHLILTGGDPITTKISLLDKYKKLSESLNIQKNTTFLGFLEDKELIKYFASCDIFVFPSALEGFGQVLLEAMASGTPVICANKPPMSEIIEGGGITFQLNNSKDLAKTIIRLLRNRNKLRDLRGKALKIAEKYDWGYIAHRYLNYIKELQKK